MVRRPRAPVEVRVASIVLYAIGAILLTMSLMATGMLLSGPRIDPVRQGGTGVLDLVLFFNAALCLLPVNVLLVVLGWRLGRGDHWAWTVTILLCAVTAVVVLLAMLVLGMRPVVGGVVLAVLAGVVGLLGTKGCRGWVVPRD
jgi:hypothetical protein